MAADFANAVTTQHNLIHGTSLISVTPVPIQQILLFIVPFLIILTIAMDIGCRRQQNGNMPLVLEPPITIGAIMVVVI